MDVSTPPDIRIGYARVSTEDQDLQAQIDHLIGPGRVAPGNVHTDKLSGKDTKRPGLETAIAKAKGAASAGATVTLVVPKLDRLSRSLLDLHGIAEELRQHHIRLEYQGTVHNPDDATNKAFFNMLGVFAEFERDLIRQRTKEGMAVARAQGKLKGGKPKLSPTQRKYMRQLYEAKTHTISDLQGEFKVGRATVYRILNEGA